MPAPCIWLVEPHSRTHADTPATHAPLGQGLIAVSAPIILSTVSLATAMALLIIGFAVRTRRVLQRQAELLHQNHTLAVMEERLTKLLAHADDAVVIVSDQARSCGPAPASPECWVGRVRTTSQALMRRSGAEPSRPLPAVVVSRGQRTPARGPSSPVRPRATGPPMLSQPLLQGAIALLGAGDRAGLYASSASIQFDNMRVTTPSPG